MSKVKTRLRDIVAILGDILWRGFGGLLFIFGASGTVGAAFTGSWVNGVIIAWGTLMLGVVGAIGYAIMTTGKASRADVDKAYRDAAEKATEQNEKR